MLVAAADSLRESIGAVWEPYLRRQRDAVLAELRTVFGDATYQRLWAQGWAMTQDQAVGYACAPCATALAGQAASA